MFVFGLCVSSPERFARLAQPGIVRCAGADATIIVRVGVRSIHEAYNRILHEARATPELEGVVLLHDDLVIRDRHVCEKLRQLFTDPSIGLVGAHGARSVDSLWWWNGDQRGRMSCVAHDGTSEFRHLDRDPEDVDAVDGCFMALPPWTVAHARFDERRYEGFHAYDVDLCWTVRALGRRVVVTDLDLHHENRLTHDIPDTHAFLRNNRRWRAKWGFENRAALPLRLAKLRMAEHWPMIDRLNLEWFRRPVRRA